LDEHTYLGDVSERDKPWDTHRQQSEQVESLYRGSEFGRYAERMQTCSRFLGFNWGQKEDTGEVALKLQDTRFCRVRNCPVCQWRKSLMWRARFYNAVPKLIESYPTYRYVFLTLTVKNCAVTDLGTTVAVMNRAWMKLSKRKQFPALGWLKAVEVTRNQDVRSQSFGTAHPHMHVLLVVAPGYFKGSVYIKQETWRELWQSCLGADYLPVVNVKAVKPKTGQDVAAVLRSAVTETLKYTVKPDDLVGTSGCAERVVNQQWLVELTRQLKGTRSVAVGGILRGFIADSDPDDLIHPEGSEVGADVDAESLLWFGWRSQVKRYAAEKKNV
jgi:plasmid rolling circle replication initiator protein Rep